MGQIKDLDENKSTETHRIATFTKNDTATYIPIATFTKNDTATYIPKEIKIFIGNKNKKIIYRTKTNDSIICGYFVLDLLILC